MWSGVSWETLTPTKILRTLVLPLRLFQNVLLCNLMILDQMPYILKAILSLNSNSERFLLKNYYDSTWN